MSSFQVTKIGRWVERWNEEVQQISNNQLQLNCNKVI
jgi:hypothetical protein